MPLTLISELQKNCDVTLALDWEGYFDLALQFYGIPIDKSRLKIVILMPKDYIPTKQNMALSVRRSRILKKLAKSADICIASDNIMYFGKPAHHFLSSAAFGDSGFTEYVNTGRISDVVPLSRRLREFADMVLRRMLGMRTRREIICNPEERIYPNSNYIAELLLNYYGSFNGSVFYPPTVFEFESGGTMARDPLKVVYIGRLEADKRISDIMAIVERARALSGKEITLSFAGRPYSEAYRNELERIKSEKPWIDFPGELHGEDKAAFLLSATYAVHALRKEAFGISITEYMKAGLVPIVPDEGGASEVVNNRELSFHTNEEAANILVKLLDNPEFREQQRRHCTERAKLFSREAYLERQRRLLKEIVGD
ncbi:MAG: glycosyltransferase [Lentisphaeria bacterium]|nr:glycosyltransferase [Lentisphaeria bacterium]